MVKQQIINAGLALMLANNVQAIAETSPDIGITLDQDHSQSKQPNSQLAPSSRGELLYLNHCLVCHESNVHIREKHNAINFSAIQGEVTRWAKELQLKWSPLDVQNVADYLNNRYYHYSE